jgi:hypothetical protein
MSDPDLLKLRQISFLIKKFPEQWENLTGNFDELELEELSDWLDKYAKYIGLDTREIFDIYEMIKANLDNLNNGVPITGENVKYPKYNQYRVEWNQNYREWGTEYGTKRYSGSDKKSVQKQLKFDLEYGDFDYDVDNTEMDDRETDDFDYRIVEQQLKKTIHNVLKEHYKLFINKKN